MPPSLNDGQATALTDLLEAELATLKSLAGALDREHAALLKGTAEEIEAAVGDKNRAVAAHREQQEQRLRWMSEAALPSSTSLTELAAGAGEPLETHLQQLVELATACQERNRQNGGLIVKQEQRTRQALGVLRREEGGDLYSLSGARDHSSESRIIGKA
ncbi:MAG: flagellar protein FlgN [Halieaceae bacterium]|jgi:flagellar biosynthesis/type III secretory pathway chaperone|nr:flagellar protein FlgN [Halieaceae bacterium]